MADFYIRSGLFERARDIYEEAIQTVTTVRDFTQVIHQKYYIVLFKIYVTSYVKTPGLVLGYRWIDKFEQS